jgi:hypothetical protein
MHEFATIRRHPKVLIVVLRSLSQCKINNSYIESKPQVDLNAISELTKKYGSTLCQFHHAILLFTELLMSIQLLTVRIPESQKCR